MGDSMWPCCNLDQIKAVIEAEVGQFARGVAPVYAFLGWEWRGEGVPDAEKIAATVRDSAAMLTMRKRQRSHTISGGGLTVGYQRDEMGVYEVVMEMRIGRYFTSRHAVPTPAPEVTR